MSTETDVFAQITPLITEEPINAVELALSISANSGQDFGRVVTNQTLPSSLSLKLLRVAERIKQNDPDYYPDTLPSIRYKTSLGRTDDQGLGLFWIRNQNIDIDSAWWNIFTERGLPYNNDATELNNEYWHRDLKDPDISRLPVDGEPLLSARPVPADANEAVPYELVYPEWFTAHPEYVQLDEIWQDLGLDIKSVLEGFRDSESNEDVDHIMIGNFAGLLPRTREDAIYTFNFFKRAFENVAFTSPTSKRISPCVQYALEQQGFSDKAGNVLGWINDEGTSLADFKNNNYYYEYEVIPYNLSDDTNVFTFRDSNVELRLGFDVKQLLVRKVKGRFKDGASHGEVRALAGKGSHFPEFTRFGEAVYPTDPTQSSYPHSDTELENYDDAVLDIHDDFFDDRLVGLTSVDPQVYLTIQVQKDFSTNVRGTHPWDFETETDLNAFNDSVYYEEIIIVDPRVKYQGIYSTGFKSQPAYKAFHRGLTETVFWESSDDDKIYKFDQGSSEYELRDIGDKFTADFEDSDALVLPISYEVAIQLRAKERDTLLQTSLAVLSISIVRRKQSRFSQILGAVLTVVAIVAAIAGFVQFGQALLGATTIAEVTSVLVTYYLYGEAISFISDEIIEILIEQLGIEAAAYVAIALSLYATTKGFKGGKLSNLGFVGDPYKG